LCQLLGGRFFRGGVKGMIGVVGAVKGRGILVDSLFGSLTGVFRRVDFVTGGLRHF
jgi:hypothetical protein